ncbi:AMP deaminase [Trypanosoma cruzi]|nr:AMP deaminase [Trypanosoma cruzi]
MVKELQASTETENGRSAPGNTDEAGTDIITQQLARARLCSHNKTNNNSNSNNSNTPTKQNPSAGTSAANNNNNNNGEGGTGKFAFGNFYNVSIDGDDGDRDFLKCAEMIANIILSRQSYKSFDKGEMEVFLDRMPRTSSCR